MTSTSNAIWFFSSLYFFAAYSNPFVLVHLGTIHSTIWPDSFSQTIRSAMYSTSVLPPVPTTRVAVGVYAQVKVIAEVFVEYFVP